MTRRQAATMEVAGAVMLIADARNRITRAKHHLRESRYYDTMDAAERIAEGLRCLVAGAETYLIPDPTRQTAAAPCAKERKAA